VPQGPERRHLPRAERDGQQRSNRQLAVPAGDYFYQIYPNASKLIGYTVQPDGGLEAITSVAIPFQSPQGLAGF
jgi:hypothetical protein